MATAAATSAAAAAVAAVPTLSSLVRKLLVDAGNKPVRVNALFAAVRALPSAASVTKTHFKRRILGQMVVRDEVRARGVPLLTPALQALLTRFRRSLHASRARPPHPSPHPTTHPLSRAPFSHPLACALLSSW